MKHEDAEALLADLGPGADRATPPLAPARPPSTPAPARAPTPARPAARTPAPAAARESANGEPPPPLTPLPEGNPEDAEAARLLEQARRTLRNRQPQKALATLEKAAAIEPTHLGIQRLLVQTRIESRKSELDALVSAAVNHFVANEYGKAKKAVARILELDPNNKKAKELSGILGALS